MRIFTAALAALSLACAFAIYSPLQTLAASPQLGVGDGGTGGHDPASARAGIGAAASGQNSDITGLSGLTTPLSTAQGGLGINRPIDIYAAAYGAICDGNSHRLSTITTLNGVNTTGWTTAQWQTVFPTLPTGVLPSLAEIDGLAISAGAQTAIATGLPFHYVVRGSCKATQSINYTGSTITGVSFDFRGATILSTATGVCAVDFTATAFAEIIGLTVIGDSTDEPYCGIRSLRTHSAAVIGENTWIEPHTDGSFTLAGYEGVASEDNDFLHPVFNNRDVNNGGMAMVLDDFNHFNAAASMAVDMNGNPFQTVTLAVNAGYSQTSNVFFGGRWFCQSCRSPLWLGGSREFSMHNGYVVNNSMLENKACVTLFYATDQWEDVNTNFQMHCEAYAGNLPSTLNPGFNGNFQNIFLITGSTATPAVVNLTYDDLSTWAKQSLIGTDTIADGLDGDGTVPITSAKAYNLKINTPSFAFWSSVPAPTVFDNAALWSGSGYLLLEEQQNWVDPSGGWSGTVCLDIHCTNIAPTQPINANSEFLYDTTWEHGLVPATAPNTAQIADEWIKHTEGTTNPVTFQDLAGNFCYGGVYGEQITTTTVETPMPTAAMVAMRSIIPGPDLNNIFGTTFDAPIIVTVIAKANYTGFASVFFMNGSGTLALVHEIALPATINTCQSYTFTLPQPTTGISHWNFSPNSVGMYIGVAADCGTALILTPDTWTTPSSAHSAFCGPDTTHMAATLSDQLNITAFRMIPSYVAQPLQQWPDAMAQARNNEFTLKSVPFGVGTTDGTYQNAGRTGAQSITIAAAGNGTITQSGNVTFSSIMFGTSPAPSITVASTDTASAHAYDTTTPGDCGPITTYPANRGFQYTITPPTGVLAGDVCMFNFYAKAFQ